MRKPLFNPPYPRRYKLTKRRLKELWRMLRPSVIQQSIRHLRCQANSGHKWVANLGEKHGGVTVKCNRCDKEAYAVYNTRDIRSVSFIAAIDYIQTVRALTEAHGEKKAADRYKPLHEKSLIEKWERM